MRLGQRIILGSKSTVKSEGMCSLGVIDCKSASQIRLGS